MADMNQILSGLGVGAAANVIGQRIKLGKYSNDLDFLDAAMIASVALVFPSYRTIEYAAAGFAGWYAVYYMQSNNKKL